jgi:NAD(P)-dependent dehydrogenase (short-subunit alcohol dehydrogenase family)
MDFFQNQRVLITGGSAGIGRAAALAAVRRGAHVAVLARGRERLEQTLAELRQIAGPERTLVSHALDVSDRAAVRSGLAEVVGRLGGLDVLVANSGHAVTGWVTELPDAAFDEMIQANYLGHVNVVRACLPQLLAQKRGHISLVSSMLGFFGGFGYTAYCGSKYAVRGFAEALRHELRPHGIRVTLFYPPTTKTPGLAHENQSKPPAVWSYESESGFNKVYEAETVAAALLRSIERGRFENLVGLDSAFMYFMLQHFPRLARWINDGELDKAVRRVEARKTAPARELDGR